MTRNVFMRFVPVILLVVACISSFAQSSGTGNITGVVSDSTGAVVRGATVSLTTKDTNQSQTATTNDDGLYNFVLLRPGNYSVKTVAPSFGEANLEVEVQVGRTTDANVTLGVGGVSAVVQVTAEGIQTTQSNSDAVLNETAIQNLPINGRRFQDFVTLTPTAQVDPQRGQISLAGQKGINGNVNVDGVDYNQPFFGGIRGGERSNLAFTIPQESIKEFQVVAAGYSAEFGRSTGGVVNAVTKSGDNNLSGSAFYLLRPSRLARGNEFTNALQTQSLGPRGITPTLAPTQHQYGGSVGGPIIKDKLFFFGSYEGQRFRAPRQIVFSFPTGFPPSFITLTPAQQAVLSFYQGEQGSYIQTNDAHAALAKVDWNITNNHRFSIRGSISRNNALNAVSRGESSVDPTTRQALSTNGTEQDRTRILVGQFVSNFGAYHVNELRFQYAHEERPRLSNSVVPQILTSFATFGAGGSDTSSFLPNREYDNRYQVTDSFTWISGNHTMKFGGEYSDIFAAQTFGFNPFGQYNASLGAACTSATACTFATSLLTLSNVPVPAAGTTAAFLGRFDSTSGSVFYQKQIGNLAAGLGIKELSFFGQDNWRINQKLSVNFGLRAEAQYNPTPDASNTQIVNLVRNTNFPIRGTGLDATQIPDSGWQWGPRAGFAYDPQGDGKTVVRGFGGVYYARTPGIWIVPATQTFRNPPADVSTRLPFTGFSQAAFNTFLGTPAGAPYIAITGCNPSAVAGSDALARCTPNTLYRQFAVAGVNLNSSPLSSLPILTNAQISSIASGLGLTPSPFVGAQVIGFAEDHKNPRSVQWGIGFEHQMARGLVIGIDYTNVSTHRISRFRDLNQPAPLTGEQYRAFLQANNTAANYNTLVTSGIVAQLLASGRNYIAINTPAAFLNPTTGLAITFPGSGVQCTGVVGPACSTRPRPTQAQQGFALGSVAVHESTAKSLYRALTFRMRFVRRYMQLNAYYTYSRLLSDDDGERGEGTAFADAYDLGAEYYASRLNRESQFVASPLFFLPYGFEVSAAIRLRSGAPFNPTVGADLNGDTVNNDRPLLVPGVVIQRNYYNNHGIFDMDMRAQKAFRFGESKRLVLSMEIFNVLNRSNLLIGGTAAPSSATSFGSAGQFCVSASQLCGLSDGPTRNPFFQQTNDPVTGAIVIANTNPGSQVFQMQFGARFYF